MLGILSKKGGYGCDGAHKTRGHQYQKIDLRKQEKTDPTPSVQRGRCRQESSENRSDAEDTSTRILPNRGISDQQILSSYNNLPSSAARCDPNSFDHEPKTFAGKINARKKNHGAILGVLDVALKPSTWRSNPRR